MDSRRKTSIRCCEKQGNTCDADFGVQLSHCSRERFSGDHEQTTANQGSCGFVPTEKSIREDIGEGERIV
jgi:hypothetical protein